MKEDAQLRVRRLTAWIRLHRKDLLDGGDVSSGKLASATGGKQAYWSDVLALRPGKSFAASAARKVEDALNIPTMHLEGYGWPFDEIDPERWNRLNERQKGRVEEAMLTKIQEIEAEMAMKANGTR